MKFFYGALIALGVIIICGFLWCCSFRPVWIKELPPECNMTLNTYRLYYNSKDKSATMPASDFCYKKLHRSYCQGEVFGYDDNKKPNAVDYTDAVKYRAYSQCLSELR